MEYTKRQAAERVGVNERTIHRAVIAGQIQARRERMAGGGERVLIDEAELDRWAAERKQTVTHPAVTRQPDTALTVASDSQILQALVSALGQISQNQSALAERIELLTKDLPPVPAEQGRRSARRGRDSVPMTDRLTLTLAEAARLSRLPRGKEVLKEAISRKKLKAIEVQRGPHTGYLIMREDLESYLRTLRK